MCDKKSYVLNLYIPVPAVTCAVDEMGMVTCIQYSPSLFLARNIYLEYFSQSNIIIIMGFFLGSVLTKRAKPESPYVDHPSVYPKSVGKYLFKP